jgi:mannose-1-phosphate guanylyltransferase
MHSNYTMENNFLIVMAGGIGSRFWPLSTPDNPKQFQDILGSGKTLFQETVERFSHVVPLKNVLVVTAAQYASYVREQLPGIPEENILSEPVRRNTAPCVAYAAYTIKRRNSHAQMIVTPSDHYVGQVSTFQDIIQHGLDWLHDNPQKLLTLGITPDRPETGYGYIQTGGFLRNEIVPVLQFKEKPDLHTAIEYLQSGDYLWNSGIFLWHVDAIIDAFSRFLPEVDSLFSNLARSSSGTAEVINTYEKSPDISIDYGILERAGNIYVLSAECGWSDLGTWGSLWQQEIHDDYGNSQTPPNTRLYESRNCVIRVPAKKQVVIEGLEDFIVVDDNEHLLIFRKENEQLIGTYSKKISQI